MLRQNEDIDDVTVADYREIRSTFGEDVADEHVRKRAAEVWGETRKQAQQNLLQREKITTTLGIALAVLMMIVIVIWGIVSGTRAYTAAAERTLNERHARGHYQFTEYNADRVIAGGRVVVKSLADRENNLGIVTGFVLTVDIKGKAVGEPMKLVVAEYDPQDSTGLSTTVFDLTNTGPGIVSLEGNQPIFFRNWVHVYAGE